MTYKKLPWTVGEHIFEYTYTGQGTFTAPNLPTLILRPKRNGQDCMLVVQSQALRHLEIELPTYPNFAAFFLNNQQYWVIDFTEKDSLVPIIIDFIKTYHISIPSAEIGSNVALWRMILAIMYEYWLFRRDKNVVLPRKK